MDATVKEITNKTRTYRWMGKERTNDKTNYEKKKKSIQPQVHMDYQDSMPQQVTVWKPKQK